ncbi:hypothetical protein GCM10007094_43130 [Pseudovibrio japonicus]|uniref:DUF4440 domain-containing protein n=1 Tax=Pseudovibrio japonicus TaxID=366534 RepID=A0ABQ3ET59_9HYPH|nr:nuclear transport factor 2 family protein [Pseudovibrio japonicus]GHB49276.1 hypothetical protein GCM10007094_43130 [Pseudovibrio japonicus]
MSLLTTLENLENQLWEHFVWGNRQQLELLLHDEFVEIGGSGHFTDRARVMAELAPKPVGYPRRTIKGYHCRRLSDVLIQVFYEVVEDDTRRTSIWRLADDRWQLIYHQGTQKAS